MAIPEFLDQDRFYLDLENDKIEWMYYNPDSVSGGQFVTNVFGRALLEKALDESLDAEDAFDYIGSNCRQHLADRGTEFFNEAWSRMESEEAFAIGCGFTTLDQLRQIFQAKELIDEYCLGEFGSKADYNDLRQIGIGYTTITDAEHDIQAYANLIDYRIEIHINWTVAQYHQYESLADMVKHGLTDLSFDDLTYLPEWLIKDHVRNADLDNLATRLTFFMKDFDPYSYADVMEAGETDADMVAKMKEDLRDPDLIPGIITELQTIINEGSVNEKGKAECRAMMTGLYHLYAEDRFVPVYDRESDILFSAFDALSLEDYDIGFDKGGIYMTNGSHCWRNMDIYTHLADNLSSDALRKMRDENFSQFIDLRDMAYHYGVMLGYDLDKVPVARLDILGPNGKVGDWIEYYSEEEFIKGVHEELDAGVPVVVVLYRNGEGKTISRNFLNDVGTLPKGLKEEDAPYTVPYRKPVERSDAR